MRWFNFPTFSQAYEVAALDVTNKMRALNQFRSQRQEYSMTDSITAATDDVEIRERSRTGFSADSLRRAVGDHLIYSIARPPGALTADHYYRALALAVRDRMQQRWMATTEDWLQSPAKVTCYLSAEFLMGPQLGNNLLNLGITAQAREAMAALGQNLDTILACEEEPGLGNGGLGRLAACYLVLNVVVDAVVAVAADADASDVTKALSA